VTSIHGTARAAGLDHGASTAARITESIDEHRRILDAICAGDATAASAAMDEHITRSWPPAAEDSMDSAA
jgi:DNA-binding GntR family transcriptional regulator